MRNHERCDTRTLAVTTEDNRIGPIVYFLKIGDVKGCDGPLPFRYHAFVSLLSMGDGG